MEEWSTKADTNVMTVELSAIMFKVGKSHEIDILLRN